jgi:hypothetical protein
MYLERIIARQRIEKRQIDWGKSLRSNKYLGVGEEKPAENAAEVGFNMLFSKPEAPKRKTLDYREHRDHTLGAGDISIPREVMWRKPKPLPPVSLERIEDI